MRRLLKETAMRYVTYVVAIATLAGQSPAVRTRTTRALANSQNYYSPSGYSYPANYSSYPAGSGYYPTRYGYGSTGYGSTGYGSTGYGSTGDYYRNYSGTRSGPQVTFTLP